MVPVTARITWPDSVDGPCRLPGQILPGDEPNHIVIIVHHHQVPETQGTELLVQLE